MGGFPGGAGTARGAPFPAVPLVGQARPELEDRPQGAARELPRGGHAERRVHLQGKGAAGAKHRHGRDEEEEKRKGDPT